MNTRFQALAHQAEEWADSQNFYESDYRDYLMEKFAELIVRECASIVYKTCQDGDAGAQAILYEFDIDNARSQK